MIRGEVIEQVKKTQPQEATLATYSVGDIAKIANFFQILIKIDQKIKLQKDITYNETKNN